MAQPAVQRGDVTLASGSTSVTITATVSSGFDTAVVRARTFLLFSVRADGDSPYEARLAGVKAVIASDGATVTFSRNLGTSMNLTIEWSLYEFGSGSGVSVQHLEVASTSAGSGNVTVTAVDLAKAWIIPSGVNMTSGPFDRWFTRLRFSSTTNVEWSRIDVTGNITFAFQVVEYPDCAVQQIDVDRTTTTATTADETISSVDAAETALFGTMRTSATDTTVDWTMSLPAGTTLRLTREGTTSQTFGATVFVVRFTDGSVVQHLSTALHDATLVNQTISAVDLAVTALDVTNVRGKMVAGRDNGDNMSRTMPTVEFSSTTNVQCRKGQNQGTVDLTFQVIEFAAGGGGGPTYAESVSGSVSLSGALAKQKLQTLAASTTPTGTLLRRAEKPLTGTVAPTGGLARAAGKRAAGTIASSGSLAKDTRKPLVGTVTPAGSLDALRSYLRAFTGTVAPTGTLTPLAILARAFTGSLGLAGAVLKQPGKAVGGTIAPTGHATRAVWKVVGGELVVAGVVSRQARKRFEATLPLTGVTVTVAGTFAQPGPHPLRIAFAGHGKTITFVVDGKRIRFERHEKTIRFEP